MRLRAVTLLTWGLLLLLVPHPERSGRPQFALAARPSGTSRSTARLGAASATPSGTEALNSESLRLSNTPQSAGELASNPHAIVLENALYDTTRPMQLGVPPSLRSTAPPCAYIVQARGTPTAGFADRLKRAGAEIVAYIPNNAYLVRTSRAAAEQLSSTDTQAVVPYEPYFKIKASLLKQVLAPETVNRQEWLDVSVLLFSGGREETASALSDMGADVLGQDDSPFGPVFRARVKLTDIPLLARLTGVQEIELARRPRPANDLSRMALSVSTTPATPLNYLGLSGKGVLVDVNDTGIDAGQPDLSGRVVAATPLSAVDTNGHGTHIAGVIAGSGAQSSTLANAPGSLTPPVPFQFRGKAPAATLLSIATDVSSAAAGFETALQQTAALSNAFICNNSWVYPDDNEYDLGAASFDAAVRDGLPQVGGAQPLLYVFPAGNAGHGAMDGTGGIPNTIQSPGTAKNVITVGAIEQPRWISNQTWTCVNECQTNTPWLPLTDSSNQVAAFSSRGNAGIGIEGDAGRFKPDLVAPGVFVLSTRSSQWDTTDYYAATFPLVETPDTNYFQVLSNLNESCGPFYRFESGTSVATAEASGTLALMQEFFEQRLGRTNSPALMKALLINGARTLGPAAGFNTKGGTNSQGWGLIHLPNSIPSALTNPASASSSMFLFDQAPAGALATGQSKTRFVRVSPVAQKLPLRITLAWTDPPANPVAGLKLVNDLDLTVTNLDSGEVFLGNDFADEQAFSRSINPSAPVNPDFVNNIENVYLAPNLGTNYSVTVTARRVAVDTIGAKADQALQDYALVISSGDGELPDALQLTDAPLTSESTVAVTVLTNSFSFDSIDAGTLALEQRAGANAPAIGGNTVPLQGGNGLLTIGLTNQWHFYVIANGSGFTNAVFLTFLPQLLSLSGPITNGTFLGSNTAPDIDLYVSTDPGLTNLDPMALAQADCSVSRGGTEHVVYSNATAAVYYAAVKSESQQAAEYGFLAAFSQLPFGETDAQGNQLLRGFPAPCSIPPGTPQQSTPAFLFSVATESIPVRRVVVTNAVSHSAFGDLRTALAHGNVSVVLNNFSNSPAAASQPLVYDDSNEGDFPWAQPTQGPGTLRDFAGMEGAGQWLQTSVSTNLPGTNEALGIFVERQQDLTMGLAALVMAGAERQDLIFVPPGVRTLSASVNFVSGTGPALFQLSPVEYPSSNAVSLLLNPGDTTQLTLDQTSHPPLNPGLCALRLRNMGPDPAMVNLAATLGTDPNPPPPLLFDCTTPEVLTDDAVSASTILVTNLGTLVSVEAGVRIEHPRVSDLALTLVSPSGTRVLLAENRGGLSTNGMGITPLVTNSVSGGGREATTNEFDTLHTSGVVTIDYKMYDEPDTLHVYYEGKLIFDSGLISGSGTANLFYGPGLSTSLTVVMNEGGNSNPNTVWLYDVVMEGPALDLTFTENTNLTVTPIKFAPAPLTNINYLNAGAIPSNGIFYLPEQSLAAFSGQPVTGPWTLEVADRRTGATNPTPRLLDWQLSLRLRQTVPVPMTLTPGEPVTNVLGPNQLQWFAIDVPEWVSFATNSVLFASTPIKVWYNDARPPTGTNSTDWLLLADTTAGSAVVQTNGSPPLQPGARCFIAVQSTNASTTFVMEVDFDVANLVTLSSGVPYAAMNPGLGSGYDFYRYVVSTNAVRAQFELNAPSADLTLFARRGLPLPNAGLFDYASANPGTNDELIVVYDFSQPVPLGPGEWFLAVANRSGEAGAYSVAATEFPVYGTNILASVDTSSGSYCLTWASLPGVHYVVEGKTNLEQSTWTPISGTLTANDVSTTYCVPLSDTFSFYRIREGLVVTPPPLIISNISVSGAGVFLEWTPPVTAATRFQVEWTDSMTAPAWHAFPGVIHPTGGTCSFLDDGSQSGGLGAIRFYRVLELP